jgi:hypothetical protein
VRICYHSFWSGVDDVGSALCNTLLITILISILSNEFAVINANAQEEVSIQQSPATVQCSFGARSTSSSVS